MHVLFKTVLVLTVLFAFSSCKDNTSISKAECQPGEKLKCRINSYPINDGRGICRPGERICINEKWDTECKNEIVPQFEACGSELDLNCDGRSGGLNDPMIGTSCNLTEGIVFGAGSICKQGYYLCFNKELTCFGSIEPEIEICDGLDNNCN